MARKRTRHPLFSHALGVVAASILLCTSAVAAAFECFPANGSDLRAAAASYALNSTNTTAVAAKYGHPIGSWCVDNVTDFSHAFDGLNLSEPLTNWKTSKATTMAYMFRGSTFNQPLSQFDVRNVVNFTGMFWDARNFDQNISGWVLHSAKRLDFMFGGGSGSNTAAFRQNLCTWGTYARNFTSVQRVFRNTRCPRADQDPNITATPPGPFCFRCGGGVPPRDACVSVTNCTAHVYDSCRTCNISSTCFTNATRACCPETSPTNAYLLTVRELYRAKHCAPNITCDTVKECSDRIWSACNESCALSSLPLPSSPCYASALAKCCSGGNATRNYRERVRDDYRQRHCVPPQCVGARECAVDAWLTCGTCQQLASASGCFRNATSACCLASNPTNSYREKVRNLYEAAYCPPAPDCVSLGKCAQKIWDSCNETCNVNASSTCYANATGTCCANDTRPSTAYLSKVDDRFRDEYCRCNPTPFDPLAACARKVRSQCGPVLGCELKADCLRNATSSCCRGPNYRNATSAQFARLVRREYNVICRSCTPGKTPIATCVKKVKQRCNTCAWKKNEQCVLNVVLRDRSACCLPGRTGRWVKKVKKRYRAKHCKKRDIVIVVP